MLTTAASPLLSVVAVSRNDDHGGDLAKRMQLFVNGLAFQAERHRLPLELVLVEWNPPAERPPLRAALSWPREDEFFQARIITVDPTIHARFDPRGVLPLFQMMAKNAGIRRARGRFVLATNVDLLFPDALFRTLRDDLREGVLYRNDRFDVARDVPDAAPFEAQIEFCRTHVLRQHRADGTFCQVGGRWVNTSPGAPRTSLGRLRRSASALRSASRRRLLRLHRNGAGDFTLLDRESWFRLGAYPEWVVFSWHLDSVFLFQADANRLAFRTLPKDQCAYHIDHGGGWTPEEAGGLFARLAKAGIRVLTDEEVMGLRDEMEKKRRGGEPVVYNGPDWGLAGEELEEAWPLQPPAPSA
jgi:hypothetical protein